MEKAAAGKRKKKAVAYDPKWAEAKTKCRLNANDVEMAKRLGFKPKSLLKNIPGPKETWKQPVKYWIRDLYREKFGTLIGEKPHDEKPNSSDPSSGDFELETDDLPF